MDYSKHVRIDLHIHSTASDGTLSPSEILDLAQSVNLGTIAITDHDTMNGFKEGLAVGIPHSVQFLTGVEVSASPPPSFPILGSLHILGYSIRLDDPVLNQTLDALRKSRKNRNPKIIERLNNLGIDISMDEVLNEVGKESLLGRPHIATLMKKKGFVESINEAFDKYLGFYRCYFLGLTGQSDLGLFLPKLPDRGNLVHQFQYLGSILRLLSQNPKLGYFEF